MNTSAEIINHIELLLEKVNSRHVIQPTIKIWMTAEYFKILTNGMKSNHSIVIHFKQHPISIMKTYHKEAVIIETDSSFWWLDVYGDLSVYYKYSLFENYLNNIIFGEAK